MHRQTISFTDPQHDFLQKQAQELAISLADLVRRIVDDYRAQREPTPTFKRGGA